MKRSPELAALSRDERLVLPALPDDDAEWEEERTLFPLIEQRLSSAALAELGRALVTGR